MEGNEPTALKEVLEGLALSQRAKPPEGEGEEGAHAFWDTQPVPNWERIRQPSTQHRWGPPPSGPGSRPQGAVQSSASFEGATSTSKTRTGS